MQAVHRTGFREFVIDAYLSFRHGNELPENAAMTTIAHPLSGWKRVVAPAAAVRGPLLAALAYFVGAESAFLVGTLSDRIFAPFWPPNVILFAVLLLAPTSRWWLYVLAATPAHVVAELQVGWTCCRWPSRSRPIAPSPC